MKRTALALCFALAAFEPHAIEVITLPNGLEGFVTATNNPGDEVGFFYPADGIPEILGFEITHQGEFLEIGPSFFQESVPGWPRDNARPVDIDDSGTIVGLSYPFLSPEPGFRESFLFDDGVYTRISFCVILSQFCGDSFLIATEIENDGDVLGIFGLGFGGAFLFASRPFPARHLHAMGAGWCSGTSAACARPARCSASGRSETAPYSPFGFCDMQGTSESSKSILTS